MTAQDIEARYGPVVGRFNSISEPEKVHEVRKNPGTGKLSCNCNGWRFRRTCKHTEYIEKYPEVGAASVACAVGIGKPAVTGQSAGGKPVGPAGMTGPSRKPILSLPKPKVVKADKKKRPRFGTTVRKGAVGALDEALQLAGFYLSGSQLRTVMAGLQPYLREPNAEVEVPVRQPQVNQPVRLITLED